ncbi:Concanavalin A-like lectin/glucanases superfamily protein [uncultured archaeon]|nr:Concanavalin A-like lectin/glucanases superfamily protein [uncultured archaeon]
MTGAWNADQGSGILGSSLMRTTAANTTVSNKISFTGPFTIEFYVDVPDYTHNVTLALSNNIFMNFRYGNVTLYQNDDSAYNYTVNVTNSSSFIFNNWNHIAITYNSNVYNSYVNLNSVTGFTQNSSSPSVPLRDPTDLGYANMLSLNITGNVYLDELKIYNRALTLSEISNDASCVR